MRSGRRGEGESGMAGAETSGAGPIDSGERSTILDALRGYALLGILIANMASFIGFYFVPGNRVLLSPRRQRKHGKRRYRH